MVVTPYANWDLHAPTGIDAEDFSRASLEVWQGKEKLRFEVAFADASIQNLSEANLTLNDLQEMLHFAAVLSLVSPAGGATIPSSLRSRSGWSLAGFSDVSWGQKM